MTRKTLAELFGFKDSDKLNNGAGEPISFATLEDNEQTASFIAPRNDAYVFPLEETIDLGIAMDENDPVLIYGLHGSGKSTLAEQYCNRANWPSLRLQHTVDTEGADIVGNWTLQGDKTVFCYGPLPRAMRDGLVYIADEYDFALPNVLAIYQAVLEGAPLFIKNAPEEMAIVHPHPNFRFIATGNTNGGGDETGLYQGTQMQNAANYSRFGMTIKLGYSPHEKEILTNTLGTIPPVDLKMLMEFTGKVRKAFADRTITTTLSTRELLQVTKLAILRGRDKLNFRYGVQRAFSARLSSIDAATVNGIADRIFD